MLLVVIAESVGAASADGTAKKATDVLKAEFAAFTPVNCTAADRDSPAALTATTR